MAINKSKAKGTRAETQAKDMLRKYTGLKFQRTPLSGALNAVHMLKSDIYVPNERNLFAIEVKHYKDEHLNSSIITSINSQFEKWWEQAEREAKQMEAKPLLLFKKDRGKFFAVMIQEPMVIKKMYISHLDVWVCLLEDWLVDDIQEFIK